MDSTFPNGMNRVPLHCEIPPELAPGSSIMGHSSKVFLSSAGLPSNDLKSDAVKISRGASSRPSRVGKEPSGEIMRRQLRTTLESRLRQKHGSLDAEKLEKASRRIEHLLFLESKQGKADLFDYTDTTNLKDRLAPVLLRLLKHKAAKMVSPKEQRRKLVLHSMGGNQVMYRQTAHMVQEIHRLRLAQASSGCCVKKYCCSATSRTPPPPSLKNVIPAPVHQLFFQVDLVPAFQSFNEKQLAQTNPLQWTSWLKEASKIVNNYKLWCLKRDT